ncbi:MAG: hypothetical protein U0514_04365 [Candidatus Andersenbacteria bacterium]
MYGSVILWAVLFSAASVVSILLLGSRDFVNGTIDLPKIVRILFDWRFILGAGIAFVARMLFILTNNALTKIPHLADSSTTITTLINSAAIILVVVANHYVFSERLNAQQGVGAFLVLAGIFLLTVRVG